MKQSYTKFKYALIFILSVLFISIISNQSISQITNWHSAQKLTSGFNDRNPSFGPAELLTFSTYNWEFMVFERSADLTDNSICVLKVGINGLTDSVTNLSGINSLNYNPSVSYDKPTFPGSNVNIALALWEKAGIGRINIYGSYYTTANGWSSPFPYDTSSFNKSNPRSIYLGNSVFATVYERNNDIICRQFNPLTGTVSYDTNLTANDTSICKNPFIGRLPFNQNAYSVSYERKKADNKNAVYFRNANAVPVWTIPDTSAFAGNNINSGFVYSYFGNNLGSVFNSDRTGNYNIFVSSIKSNGSLASQEPAVPYQTADNSNFHSFIYPIITDRNYINSQNSSFLNYQAAAYVRKGSDSVKVMLYSYSFSPPTDSSTAGNASANVSLTMNRGLKFGNYDARIWAIYNKDSVSFSMLYGRYIDISLTGIIKSDATVPDEFRLYQNYPNPFNPVTKIKFGIPANSFVKITIYDVLGKEIDIPLNQNLDRGSYEVTWDGSKFAGGAYFYKFETEAYSDVKKLILLK